MPAKIAAVLDSADRDPASSPAGWPTPASVLFLGRHVGFPVALEGALKLKELAYIHAEGFAAGELKHGPIALIEPGQPVFVIVPARASADSLHDKVVSNIQEIRARGARDHRHRRGGRRGGAAVRRRRHPHPAGPDRCSSRCWPSCRCRSSPASSPRPRASTSTSRATWPSPSRSSEPQASARDRRHRRRRRRHRAVRAGRWTRTPGLLERLFTAEETTNGCRPRLPLRSLAARFAAKEALIKALGDSTGMRWHDMRVVSDELRQPLVRRVRCHGRHPGAPRRHRAAPVDEPRRRPRHRLRHRRGTGAGHGAASRDRAAAARSARRPRRDRPQRADAASGHRHRPLHGRREGERVRPRRRRIGARRRWPAAPTGSACSTSPRRSSCAPPASANPSSPGCTRQKPDFTAAVAAGIDIGVSSSRAGARTGRLACGRRAIQDADQGRHRAQPQRRGPRGLGAPVRRGADYERRGVLTVTGIFSHLANAGAQADAAQLDAFHRALSLAEAAGLHPPLIHLAATAGALERTRGPVRPGAHRARHLRAAAVRGRPDSRIRARSVAAAGAGTERRPSSR